LHQASEQWIGVINGEIVCHTGIIQFPMRKGWKRVHRLVVLPDYQGIGIGVKFINEVSRDYIEKGLNMNLTTTTPALVHALARSQDWLLIRKSRNKSSMADFVKYGTGDKEKNKKISKSIVKAQSNNRITYSFNFKK
jgi:GNAT superfamily N-acetyltransferase